MSSRMDSAAGPESIVSSKRLKAIVDGALDGLQVIEKWCVTSTDHPQLQQIIQTIRDHALLCDEAIGASINAAQDGHGLSCDAIELCGHIIDPETDQAQLPNYILVIQDKTRRTYENSVAPLCKFKDVCNGLSEVKNVVSMERLIGQDAVKGVYIRLSPLISGEEQYTELDTARQQLHQLALAIAKLIDNFDEFTAWWHETHALIERLELMSKVLMTEKVKFRVKTVQRGWYIMRDDYTRYKTEVSHLQGYRNIRDPSRPERRTQCKVLGAIFESSLECLHIMDPWRKASIDHPLLERIIQRVRDYAWIYFEAIEASLKAAEDGYRFSCDAIELCGNLFNPKTDEAQLQIYISDIKYKSKRIHDDSVAILGKFRKVRLGLFKATNEIPKSAILLPENEKRTSITLVSRMFGNGGDESLEATLKELNLTALDMVKLADNATKFTDWWTAAEIVLTIAEDDSNTLSEVREDTQTNSAQRTWIDIQDKYRQYKDQIIPLQDHYPPDPLRELERVAPFEDLKAIVGAAFDSLQMITPWRNATTDHPHLQQVIKEIQSHALIYIDAINSSIQTAQDGYAFSSDAIELCGHLLDPATETEQLREYIEDMVGKAKSAHSDSIIVLGKFRGVRKGLVEIARTIPREALLGPVSKKGAVVRLWSRMFGEGEKRDLDLEAAMKELNLVASDVAKLADDVGKFAGWWTGTETALSKAEKDARGLRPGKDRLRVKVIQKQWTIIRDDYKQYKAQVIQLQDHLLSGE